MPAATIGPELAKDVLQVHGVTEAGKVVFNRAITRRHLLRFFPATAASRCRVWMRPQHQGASSRPIGEVDFKGFTEPAEAFGLAVPG